MIIIPDHTRPIQRAGHKSRHPLLFVLDWLCQRAEYTSDTYLRYLCVILWVSNLFLPSPIFILYWIIALPIFHLDYLYRFIRHRYFARHHLPGPYGWGTLDHRDSPYYQ